MSQYSDGVVNVTNGSQTVIGTETRWNGRIQVGDAFTVEGSGIVYDVGAIVSDTELTLSSNYVGQSGTGLTYYISRDFTPVNNLILFNKGDNETAALLNKNTKKLDSLLVGLSAESSNTASGESFPNDPGVGSLFSLGVGSPLSYTLYHYTGTEWESQLGEGLSAGDGIDITSTIISVEAGNGITVSGSGVSVNESQVDHNGLLNYSADEHIDWTTIGSPSVNVDRISELSVTQHEAALTITESQISDLQAYIVSELDEDIDAQGNNINNIGMLMLSEIGSPSAAVSGKGQIFVRDDTPNTLVFQDDVGETYIIAGALKNEVEQLSDLDDVAGTTATNRNLLIADGTYFVSRALTEADVSDLGSYLESVVAANVDSEAATDGYILTADGSGNAVWESRTINEADINDFGNYAELVGSPEAINDSHIAETSITQHQGALTITESQISDLQSYITAVNDDSSPELGGDLDVSTFEIISTGSRDIIIKPDAAGSVVLDDQHFPQAPGTAGQVLTIGSPTTQLIWDDAAGGGGDVVKITSGSVAGSPSVTSSIEITGLSSTYYAYEIFFTNLQPATDNQGFAIHVSTDNGSTWKTDSHYEWGMVYRYGGSGLYSNASTADSDISFITWMGNAAGEKGVANLKIYNPAAGDDYIRVTFDTNYRDSADVALWGTGGGSYYGSPVTSVDAVKFHFWSGTIASCDYIVYGYKA